MNISWVFKMKMRGRFLQALIAFILCSFGTVLCAQGLSGLVEYPHLGYSFAIPAGWSGYETPRGMWISREGGPATFHVRQVDFNDKDSLSPPRHIDLPELKYPTMIAEGSPDTVDQGGIALRLSYDSKDGPVKVYRVWVQSREGSERVEISGLAQGHYYARYVEEMVLDIVRSIRFRQPSGSLVFDQLIDRAWISSADEPGIPMTVAKSVGVIRTLHLYHNGRYAGWTDRLLAQPDSSTAFVRGKWSIRATQNMTEVVLDQGGTDCVVEYTRTDGGALLGIQHWSSKPLRVSDR